MSTVSDARLIGRFRRALLLLAAATAAGTAVELAMHRHWNGTEQIISWVTLAIVAAAVVLAGVRPGRPATLIGRSVALVAVVSGAFGAYEHAASNYHAGPLDFRYTDRWPSMSEPSRWWAAVSGEVGPSPPLAPGILALAGACLFFALMGRTARIRREMTATEDGRAEQGETSTAAEPAPQSTPT